MRIASIKPNDLAVVINGHLVPIGEALTRQGALPKGASMIDLITQYDSLKGAIAQAMEKGSPIKLDTKKLKPPVENPSKIWAAATNYKRESEGLDDARGRGTASTATPEEILERTFLKPPSAIVGLEEKIIIPKAAETIFPELELCVVIGKKSRNLSKTRALDAVFGYTIILDVTTRGYGSGKCASGKGQV